MKSLPRWVGISLSLHAALGVGAWAAGRTGEPLPARPPLSAMTVELIRSSDASTPSDPVARGTAAIPPARPPARMALPTEASVSRPDETPPADIRPITVDSAPSIAGSSLQGAEASEDSRLDHEAAEPSDLSTVSLLQLQRAPEESAARSHDDYRPLVLMILDRAKRYPPLLQRRGVEGAVDLTFLISSEGKIIGPRVVVPSAHQWLNQESLAMLDRIESLPPPPDGIAVQFPVRIEYRLESIASPISTEGAYP